MRGAATGLACLLGAVAASLPARADDVEIHSAQPDSVSVTVYRDMFALITETRTVDLPAGSVTLVFDGVIDTLLPQSASVTDTGRAVAEGNYDYDRLTPARLLEESIGRKVTLTRTNPATGRVRQVEATLIAANSGGVTFQITEGTEALHCSGLPEQLSFEEVPGELRDRATLSLRLAAGTPGKRQVRVSYIAHGLGWNADYVANLDAVRPRMELRGWLTLANLTGSGFRDAQVQVVAGRLNLVDADDGGTGLLGDTSDYTDETLDEARTELLEEVRDYPEALYERLPVIAERFGGCYPLGTTGDLPMNTRVNAIAAPAQSLARGEAMAMYELEEVIVTGARQSMAVRENLADYQMYRLPGTTDLAAHQTKQVAFLHQPEVKAEKFYSLRLANYEDSDLDAGGDDSWMPIDVKVSWRNRKADGLGEPMPGGTVRFFENGPGGNSFIGENRIRDTPVDTPVELIIAKSVDLGVAMVGSDEEPQVGLMSLLTRRAYLPIHLRVMNDKSRPVVVEIRQGPLGDFEDFRVVGASLAPKRKAGDYLWRFTVPAGGEQELSYRVGGRIPDDEFE